MSAIAPRIDPAAASGSPLDEAIERFYESVVRTQRVDPLTTEIVRLRCAGYHGCRFCASVRDAQALEMGLDEELVGKLADFERSALPERWKAALRLADALMIEVDSSSLGAIEQANEVAGSHQARLSKEVKRWLTVDGDRADIGPHTGEIGERAV